MALSSDEIIKREIIENIGVDYNGVTLRIFPESSREDQKLFQDGGLTFGHKNVSYGSCDACWFINSEWVDGYDGSTIDLKPVIALEGTDALSRNSGGNALYQRFHHALGAVRNGVLGVYYLKKGNMPIQPDLYGMAYNASLIEKGDYIITDDLTVVINILDRINDKTELDKYIEKYKQKMFNIFNDKFQEAYGGDWSVFAKKRSTIIKDDYVIKYAGRSKRNFTDSSQRAGHIAVGEMYLTKYYFYDKKFYYLFPKMTNDDLIDLDNNKNADKEWFLLRNEPNVYIKTLDDLINLRPETKEAKLNLKIKKNMFTYSFLS